MATMRSGNSDAQMRKGVLEYCTLIILSRGSCYASDIIRELREAELIVVEGTLYPLLTRQKNAGLLTYHWEESSQGPPRKYYQLTNKGEAYLKELDGSWHRLIASVAKLNRR